ncbi:receptor-type tyrosine-protein phosphatase kappa-like [Glandiceps talaboti]
MTYLIRMAGSVYAAILFSLTLHGVSNVFTNGQSCDIVEPPENRLPCYGEGNSGRAACLEMNCCYDSTVGSGVPSCSFPKRCSIEETDRNSDNLANPKVWTIDCFDMGLCWFHRSPWNTRYCFFPYECDITPPDRVSCESNDMYDCLARGCCFDDRTDSNIPNCYQANGCGYSTFNQNGICTNCNCLQPCDRTTGECSTMCVDGFIGLNCQSDGLPFITTITQDAIVNSGQPTNFTCSVQGNVQTTVTIQSGSTLYSPTSTIDGVHPNYVHIYTFNEVPVTNGENVTCIATYSGGTSNVKEIEALTFVLPQLTSEPWITNVNKTQVTVNWNAWQSSIDIGDGPIEKYEVWYKNTSENDFVQYQNVLPTQTSSVVNGLTPYSNYMFALKAYRPGVGGGGSLSPHITGETSCDNPLGSPTLIKATTPISSEIHVIWELNEVDLEPHRLRCGGVMSYTVHYRVNGSNKEYNTIKADSDVTGEIITQLNPCTNYEVTVTMNNEAGGGPYSNLVISKTLPHQK